MPRFQGVPVDQKKPRFGGGPVEAPQMSEAELAQIFNDQFRLTPQTKQQSPEGVPTFEGSGFLGGVAREQTIKPELPKNIAQLPEVSGGSGLLSTDIGAAARLAPVLAVTTDPEEIADIITSSVPEVQKVYERDNAGNVFPVLVNNETGAAASINKPGLSGMDVVNLIGLGAAFTPAGRTATVAGGAGKAALTESAIQTLQAATGGDFDPEDVAFSAVGGGAFKGVEQLARLGRVDLFRPSNVKLFDESTGLPSSQLQQSLKKYDLDAGAIYDDLDNLPVFTGNKSVDDVVNDIVVKKFEGGDLPDSLYNKKLVAKKVIDDPLGEEALTQGYRKGDIASAKSANNETKQEMKRMLNMKRAIQAQSDKALDFRPTDVVGENSMFGFNYVRNRVSALRKELDEVAKKELSIDPNRLEGPGSGGLLKGREINPKIVADDYIKGLDDLNIEVDSSVFPPKLDFSKSLISEDKTSQRIINSVTRLLAKDKAPDALAAHLLKKQLDNMLDFNKKSAAGLTESGEKFAKKIRASLNETIREVSPRYAAINDEMSAGISALNDFDEALGGGVDAFADNAPKAVGTTLKRLLTNVQSRANLEDSLINIFTVADNMGAKFKVDIKKLIQFNNTLDTRFGATERGSMQGIMDTVAERGFQDARNFGVVDAADLAVRTAAKGYQKAKGINETNAFNVMQKILSQ